jgi:UDP-N-acetylglucosamine 2-epimerase (non-hydrolysing)
MNHVELIKYIKKCKFVISDSGGLQEECSYLNKKIIVCRKTTERPEGINTGHIILCENPSDLISYVDNIVKDYNINTECPYGDGRSSEKILKIIREW